MTNQQLAGILLELFEKKNSSIIQLSDSDIACYGITDDDFVQIKETILQKFNNGIKHLNKNQLSNIIERINKSGYDEELVKSRLKFYEVDKNYIIEIMDFFKNFTMMNIQIDVSDIDADFKGLQVASRDDFNMIINQGYTGDWVITPSSIKVNRVQVASMNELGKFPRGYYLNADIEKITPIKYDDQIRYRIFIKNPVVVDSGNRNVKFNVNPIRYID
ncbi:MAG: hypothetical protein IR153_06280 [Flavobacterium sp.]|nr:hypothetical protein [Flavobacterium sp.]